MNIRNYIFFFSFLSFQLQAQVIHLIYKKGDVQQSVNGKSGWKKCLKNEKLTGYLKIDKDAQAILGEKGRGKAKSFKQPGVYSIEGIRKEIEGYNNDAGIILWNYVTCQSSEINNSSGAVHRGEDIITFPLDSSMAYTGQIINFHLDNEVRITQNLIIKSWECEQCFNDTTIRTSEGEVSILLKSQGGIKWGISNWENPSSQNWSCIKIVSKEDYDVELLRYQECKESLLGFDDQLIERFNKYYSKKYFIPFDVQNLSD
jgi:hypothetical protein